LRNIVTTEYTTHAQPVTEHSIQVGTTPIRFLEAGAIHAGPPLLMLHGYRRTANYWLPNPLPALAAEHRVIAPDLPGFGLSGELPTYGLPQYAAILHAFLDALGIGPANLLGHSMGSQVAIAIAASQPQRANKLILVDSAGLPRLEPRWQLPLKTLADSSLWSLRWHPIRSGSHPRPLTHPRPGSLKIVQREHIGTYLKALTMPTLIIWGSRDRVVPLEHGALLARRIPHARLAIIRASGHMPFAQKPDEFNQLVLSFLRNTEC
jgi:pimeloyl-ACP methyl ester carboxylesterase